MKTRLTDESEDFCKVGRTPTPTLPLSTWGGGKIQIPQKILAAPRLTLRTAMLATALLWIWQGAAWAASIQIDLSGKGTVSKAIELKDLESALPSDWSGYEFLVMEFKCSSPQRFELGLQMPDRVIHKNMHAFAGALVRAAIPLKYFYAQPSEGYDLASLYNKLAGSYWINIDGGGYEPLKDVSALVFTIHNPVGKVALDIRSIGLARQSPGDAVLDPKILVDEFGQWIPADWPGKAHSLDDLKAAWSDEEASLGKDPLPDRDEYGGFASTQAKATGFFRVEQIDGRWWFVDPKGHYFFSNGVNGIGIAMPTKVAGREGIFAAMPPKELFALIAQRAPTTRRSMEGFASFYTWNLVRRYGTDNWQEKWATLTARRMADWGINTFYGPNPDLQAAEPRRAYVLTAPIGRPARRCWGCRMFMPTISSSAWTLPRGASAMPTRMIRICWAISSATNRRGPDRKHSWRIRSWPVPQREFSASCNPG